MMLNTPAQKRNSILKSNRYSQLLMALTPFKETCSSTAEHLLKRYHCSEKRVRQLARFSEDIHLEVVKFTEERKLALFSGFFDLGGFFSLCTSLLCWGSCSCTSSDIMEVIEDRLRFEASCGQANISIRAHKHQRDFRDAVSAVGIFIAIDQDGVLGRGGSARAGDGVCAQQARCIGQP